jgi:hypothetical protein
MMIARNWSKLTDTVEGHHLPSPGFFPLYNAYKVGRSDPVHDAQKRDREVPYGMKGGEHTMASKKGGSSSKSSASSSKKSSGGSSSKSSSKKK